MHDDQGATSAEAQLASFFAKYEPATEKLGKTLRAKLRKRLPGLSELVYVYDNQDALVISYSPSEKGYEGVCSIGLYPRSAKLFFGQGAQLSKSDPKKLLQGSGKIVRHVELAAAADLDRPEIRALMTAALKLAKIRLDPKAKGQVIIRTGGPKPPARRKPKAESPTSRRRTTGTRR